MTISEQIQKNTFDFCKRHKKDGEWGKNKRTALRKGVRARDWSLNLDAKELFGSTCESEVARGGFVCVF